MATIANNVLIQGLRGMLGRDLVFKVIRGKTIVCAPARKPRKTKETAAQRNTRSRFRAAALWAKMQLLDPEKKAFYQQQAKILKLPNAYTAAIKAYMRALA